MEGLPSDVHIPVLMNTSSIFKAVYIHVCYILMFELYAYMNNQVHIALFRKEGEGKERELQQPQWLRKYNLYSLYGLDGTCICTPLGYGLHHTGVR